MQIIQLQDYDAMSRKAAALIAAQIDWKPKSVLGLLTGSTPIGTYEHLVEWHRAGELDFSQVKTFNLDEYVGLAPEHEQSYCYFMRRHLLDHINIPPENVHLLNGLATDIAAECAGYDAAIATCGGIDLLFLGLGRNGHIGFNEPAEVFTKGTNKATLAQSSLEANKRFFPREDMPRFALTMGIGNIFSARKILLAVSGAGKAQIVKQAVHGPITPDVPASILQLHPDAILLGDAAALSLL